MEAMDFRATLPHYAAFLSRPREERLQAVASQLLSPPTDAQQKRLQEIRDAFTVQPPEHVLRSLGRLWNEVLVAYESRVPAEAPAMPISLGPDTIAVVLGGKLIKNDGLHGVGDRLVEALLQVSPAVKVVSFARNRSDGEAPAGRHHHHFTSLSPLMDHVRSLKAPHSKIVFCYTICLTNDNGENQVNIDAMESFITAAGDLLADPNVSVLVTDSFHSSSSAAGHEDNIPRNYVRAGCALNAPWNARPACQNASRAEVRLSASKCRHGLPSLRSCARLIGPPRLWGMQGGDGHPACGGGVCPDPWREHDVS